MRLRGFLLPLALVLAPLTSARGAPASPTDTRLGHGVVPTAEAVRLAVDAGQDGYRGSVRIDLDVRERSDSFRFHARDLSFSAASLRSDKHAYAITLGPERDGMVTAHVSPALEPGACTLALDFDARFGADGSGFYKLTVDGRSYAFTQFEPAAARRAFPCWDEPEFKIPWQITLILPKDQLAISNAAVDKETPVGEQKAVVFRTTPPLPSYLVAFATGPFEAVEIPGLSVPGRIITCAGQSRLTGQAARVVPALLKPLEDYFGQAYPFDKLDVIAVPGYAYGAMENPGAVMFNDKLLLIDPDHALPGPRRQLVRVMAHELAHMWFGDLVTMRWWDDLWLSEAFASWMGGRISDQVFPEYRTSQGDVVGAHRAMAADARPNTHPIRRRVDAPDQLGDLADGLSYDKGQAVLGMFEQWLGTDVFQNGVSRYLRDNAWKTATAGDLWKSLGEASGRDMAAPMRTFLDQPGVPLVSCELFENGRLVLHQQRLRTDGAAAGPQRWNVPVAIKYSDGATLHAEIVFLTEATQSVDLPTGRSTRWVLPDLDARGYYRWQVPDTMLDAIGAVSQQLLTPRERVAFVYNLIALLDAGVIHGGEYLAAVRRFGADPDADVLTAVMAALDHVRRPFSLPGSEPLFAGYVHATLSPALDHIGANPRPGESEAVGELRPELMRRLAFQGHDAGVMARGEALTAAFLKSPESIAPSVADAALQIAAIRGDTTLFSEYAQRFEVAATPEERARFLDAIGSFGTRALVHRALDYSMRGPLDAGERLRIPTGIANSGRFDDDLFLWLATNYDAITSRMPASYAVALPRIVQGCSPQQVAAAQTYFDDPRHHPAGTEQEFTQMSQAIRECAELREREGGDAATWLEANYSQTGEADPAK